LLLVVVVVEVKMGLRGLEVAQAGLEQALA
jgi:hypothetical protein